MSGSSARNGDVSFAAAAPRRAPRAVEMTLGRSPLARALSVLAVAAGLALLAWIGTLLPAATADAWLLAGCCAVAALGTARTTRIAERALAVSCARVMPRGAAAAWRRGWLQSQAAVAGAVSFIAVESMASARGFGPSMWMVPGAVVAAQAAGSWAAAVPHDRAARLAITAAWLWPLVVLLYVRSTWTGGVAGAPPPALALALLLAGAATLALAWRRLARASTEARERLPSTPGRSALSRALRSWQMVNRRRRSHSWDGWFTAAYLFTSSFWIGQRGAALFTSDLLPLRLAVLLGLVGLCCTTLSIRELHWRQWLQPGAPTRGHLGRRLFISTAAMFAIVGTGVLTLACAGAWFLGHGVARVLHQVVDAAVMVPELLFATAAATVLTALLKGRVRGRHAVAAAVAALVVSAPAWLLLQPWRLNRGWQGWPRTGPLYAVALGVLAVILVAWADRLWRRRDLQALMQQGSAAD